MFKKQSLIVVPKDRAGEEQLMEVLLAADADDMRDEGDSWSIVSTPDDHETGLQTLKEAGIEPATSEVTHLPENSVKVAGKQAAAVLRMIEALEDQDDVQNVYANFDIDDQELRDFLRSGNIAPFGWLSKSRCVSLPCAS